MRLITAPNRFSIVFNPLPGRNLPPNQSVTVYPTQAAAYTVTNPVLVAKNSLGLDISGTPRTTYCI